MTGRYYYSCTYYLLHVATTYYQLVRSVLPAYYLLPSLPTTYYLLPTAVLLSTTSNPALPVASLNLQTRSTLALPIMMSQDDHDETLDIASSTAIVLADASAVERTNAACTLCKEYTQWGAFTQDVHKLAGAQGKQVLTDPKHRGGKGRHMICSDRAQKRLAYERAVLERCAGDKDKQKAYLASHPFEQSALGLSACPFVVVASRSQAGKPIRVSAAKTVLTHSESCSSIVRHQPQTLKLDPHVNAVVHASGGKASAKQLQAAALQSGLVADSQALYSAQQQIQKLSNGMLELRLSALPTFLADIVHANPGTVVDLQLKDDGSFDRAFLMLDSCVQAALVVGRKVAGSDFGHLQHGMFDGVEASGCFKTGGEA